MQRAVCDRREGRAALASRERHAARTQCGRGAAAGAGVSALRQERRGYVILHIQHSNNLMKKIVFKKKVRKCHPLQMLLVFHNEIKKNFKNSSTYTLVTYKSLH